MEKMSFEPGVEERSSDGFLRSLTVTGYSDIGDEENDELLCVRSDKAGLTHVGRVCTVLVGPPTVKNHYLVTLISVSYTHLTLPTIYSV